MTLPEEKESMDQEIESARKYTERKLRAEMKDSLAEMEKRMLLRRRGKQSCRVCHVFETQRGIYQENLLSPPPTDLERLWHEGNHGDYLPNDPSRALPGLSPAVNWGEFENRLRPADGHDGLSTGAATSAVSRDTRLVIVIATGAVIRLPQMQAHHRHAGPGRYPSAIRAIRPAPV